MKSATTLRAFFLPLRAGGGWEGVKLLCVPRRTPHPNPPLQAGEEDKGAAKWEGARC